MITKKIKKDPKVFEVSDEARPPEKIVDSPIQIIEGTGSTALLGVSTFHGEGEPGFESKIEPRQTPEGETVVDLVNAVSKQVETFRDNRVDVPRMEVVPETRKVFLTGTYMPGASLTMSDQPLPPELVVEVFDRVLTAA